jgi:hypothetical protein
MCYMVYLSTDCPDDLARQSSDLVRFRRLSVESDGPSPRGLMQEHRWYVGSKSECSCTFRHLMRESLDLGFGAPEDWYPEERDHLDATHELYCVVKTIADRGHQVQLLDCWSGDEGKDPVQRDVSLSDVGADAFRLFEGHVFNLKP